ncbi:uncharacterized protein LOC130314468 [Hyla sarda]|uniref:uncharacterized protein LOC130314468 n=1 Tax=Hyla sarda TaxID=327740 RepID=UPI0024C3EED7|nr:uncharacterized protein LOC130314468 [Hyla sarda]
MSEELIEFISEGLTFVFNNTTFLSGEQWYKQETGTPMGTPVSCTYANLFLGVFENSYVYSTKNPFLKYIKTYHRYVDDIIVTWTGTETLFEQFVEYLNNNSVNMHFTSQYGGKKFEFLDLRLVNDKGSIITENYRKDVARNTLQHYHSSHRPTVKNNIPYGQFIRLKRNNTNEMTYIQQANALENRFKERAYPESIIKKGREKAEKVKRKDLLKNKVQPKEKEMERKKFTFVFQNSTMNSVMEQAIRRNWFLLEADEDLKEVAQSRPRITYKKNITIGETINKNKRKKAATKKETWLDNVIPKGNYKCRNYIPPDNQMSPQGVDPSAIPEEKTDIPEATTARTQCKRPAGEGIKPVREKEFYDKDEYLYVTCDSGYRLSSSPSPRIQCINPGRDNEWSSPPQCIAQCKRPAGKGIKPGGNKFYNKDEYTYMTCETGYRLSPSSSPPPSSMRILCINPGTDNEWNPHLQCIAQCKRPAGEGIKPGGKEFYDKYESLDVTCDTGYRLSSSSSPRIHCINPDTDNEWSPPPQCIEQCKKPSIRNLEKLSPYKEYYNRGDKITLQCNPGYYPSYNTIQCKNNGSRSDWTPSAVCIEQCKKPSIRNLEKLSPYKEYYNRGDKITLQGNPGYYPSYNTIQCKNNGGRSDWTPSAVCIGVKVTIMEVTSTSIQLSIVCTPDQCKDTQKTIKTCIKPQDPNIDSCKGGKDVTFSGLKPYKQYEILITHRRSQLPLQTLHITTGETVPAAPEMVQMPSMEDGTIIWKINDDRGNITGSELNIVGKRDYNSSFSLNLTEWSPPNVTQYKISLQHGTNYTFRVRGFTSAGGGEYKDITMETPIGDPPEPRVVRKDLSFQLVPVSDVHGPIRSEVKSRLIRSKDRRGEAELRDSCQSL